MKNIKKFIGINGMYKYGRNANSYDIAKFLAIFFMVIDHLGYFFFPETYIMRGLGRAAFPIFFFLIGYSKYFNISYNLLVLGSVITIYRGYMTGVYAPTDILLTAFIVRIVMDILVKKNYLSGTNLIIIMVAIIVWHLGVLLYIGYGMIGALFAICGYLKRLENEGQPQKLLPFILITSVIMDMVLQTLFWEDAMNFIDLFSAISIFLVYYFITFEIREININNKFFNAIILFFSRNSLFVYWTHFMLFITLSALLGIANHH